MSNYLNFGVKTRNDLKRNILGMLGYPLVQVELHDSHLEMAIDNAVELYTKYCEQERKWMALDLSTYDSANEGFLLPDHVHSIFELNQTTFGSGIGGGINTLGSTQNIMYNAGVMPDPSALLGGAGSGGMQIGQLVEFDLFYQYSKVLNQVLNRLYQFTFNPRTHRLTLYPDPVKQQDFGHVVVGCFVIRSDEDNYGEHFIKRYALASAKTILGQIRNKFDGVSLLGGAKINTKILDEGLTEQKALEEELQQTYVPMGFLVM